MLHNRPETEAVRVNDEADAVASNSGSTETIQVSMDGMRKLNVRPPFDLYLRQLWERRNFIVTDARFRAFRTAKSYNLWRFWLVAQPLLDAAMYGLIFGFLLKTSRGVDNFLGFLLIGVTFFNFLTSMVNGGQSLIQTSRNLIQAFSFPKASLVFSQSLRYMIDSIPALLIALVVGLAAQWGTPLSWTIVLVIPLLLLMWAFGTGLMFVVALITAFVPDFKVIISVAIRAWFFSSGIFFPLERFAHSPVLFQIFSLNPGYIFLTAVRDVVLYATVPSLSTWLSVFAWGLGTLLVGLFVFWLAEDRYVNVRN